MLILTIVNIWLFSKYSQIFYIVFGPSKYQVGAFTIFAREDHADTFLKWKSDNGVEFDVNFDNSVTIGFAPLNAKIDASLIVVDNVTYAYSEWQWRQGLREFRYLSVSSRGKDEVSCKELDLKKMVCVSIYDLGMPFTLLHYYGAVDIDSFNPIGEHTKIKSEISGFKYPYKLLFQYAEQ
ncbi:hypothetical protein QT397_20690 [Microbulbifer sp. MKSA007]|nr:hypothetical protein QT397_20690 [Microbulbifer sp. MKSA007]